MLTITINNDYYAYIDCEGDDRLFNLIKKSFTRKEKIYNNFYKMYETRQRILYSLVENKTVIKVKAGLVYFLCNSLYINKIKYNLIDNRKNVNERKIDIQTKLSDDIELIDYQIEAVNNIFKHPFSSVQLPTGTGKTFTAVSVIKSFLLSYPEEAAIYVVPTDKLRKDSTEIFKSCDVKVNTEFPIQKNSVNIFTYMGLIRANTDKLDYKQRDLVGLICYDEMHHLAAEKSSKISHRFKNLRMCIGMTATLSEDINSYKKCFLRELNVKEFNIFGSTGKVCYNMNIDESINNKFITPIEVRVVNYQSPHRIDDENDWHNIKNIALKDVDRAQFISKYTKHIVKNANLDTVALLIPEVEWSALYMKHLAKEFSDIKDIHIFEFYGNNRVCEWINGKQVEYTKQSQKDDAWNAIKNPKIRTVASFTSFFFEGVDIKNLQAVINCYGGKDSKRVKQQCGRTVRLFEGKNIAYIHEIKDSHPILKRQFEKRIQIYKDEYNAKIIYSSFKK